MRYVPRFTLRKALIALVCLALFLGWLRPDRARYRSTVGGYSLEFSPTYPALIVIYGLPFRVNTSRRLRLPDRYNIDSGTDRP